MSEPEEFDRGAFDAGTIEKFRANGGRLGPELDQLNPLLLFHHKGAKSGRVRVNPAMYATVGDASYAIFASKGGEPENPGWYYNLLAHPRTRIEVGSETLEVVAREAEGAERERIWEAQKQAHPMFAEMEGKTSRLIPVIVFDPIA